MPQTQYFGIPLIDPAAKFDGANDLNEMANAIDTAARTVQVLGEDAKYTLPIATPTRLGGVMPDGKTVKVASDGTISVDVDPYTLPPASPTTLGGVIVPDGSGLNLTPEGEISIDDSSVNVPDGSVTTSKIADNAITTNKIADGAVALENLAPSIQSQIADMQNILTGKQKTVPCVLETGVSAEGVEMFYWAGLYTFIIDGLKITADGNTTSFLLFEINPPEFNGGKWPDAMAKIVNPKPFVGVYKNDALQSMETLELGWNLYSDKAPLRFSLNFTAAPTSGEYTVKGQSTFFVVAGKNA